MCISVCLCGYGGVWSPEESLVSYRAGVLVVGYPDMGAGT